MKKINFFIFPNKIISGAYSFKKPKFFFLGILWSGVKQIKK